MSPLSRQEFLKLWKQFRQGNQQAYEQLVQRNLGLVFKIAQQYTHQGHQDFEDLVQEGTVGLLQALQQFNPRRRCQFSTYAFRAIWHCIARWRDRFQQQPYVPLYLHGVYKKFLQHRTNLQQKLQRPVSFHEALRSMKISATQKEAMEALLHLRKYPPKSIYGITELGAPPIDIPDETLLHFTEQSYPDRQMLQLVMTTLLPRLPDKRAKEILTLRYGLNGAPAYSLDDVATLMNVSRERVRQIERESLFILRGLLLQRKFDHRFEPHLLDQKEYFKRFSQCKLRACR